MAIVKGGGIMPLWQYIAGYIMLILAVGAIVLMIYSSIKSVTEENVKSKEGKED